MGNIYISDENLYNMEKERLEIVKDGNITKIVRKETTKQSVVEIIFCDKKEILLQRKENYEWCTEVCDISVTSNVLIVYYRKEGEENMKQYVVPLE